jgi:hypothetical protein
LTLNKKCDILILMNTRAWKKKFDRDDDWKKSEEQIIKKNYKTKTDKQIAKILGRTARAVQTKRIQLKIKKARFNPKFWTSDEEEILINKYQNYTVKQITNDFLPNKTSQQIKDKAHRLRLCKSKWTDEELDLLVEYGGKISSIEIAKEFVPNKTPNQIRAKLLKGLGISRRKFQREKGM